MEQNIPRGAGWDDDDNVVLRQLVNIQTSKYANFTGRKEMFSLGYNFMQKGSYF